MSNQVPSFRRWWQKPRKIGSESGDRQVSFLELFYDLVYVALIAQLSHTLVENLTVNGFINFVFMFVVVWWSWLNGTMYHDHHGNNDIKTRIFTFLQMFGVVGMAIFAGSAMNEGANGFALSIAYFQLILTILWWRSGVHHKENRVITRPYLFFYLISTLLFGGSVFVDAPGKYLSWIIATILSLLLPAILFMLGLFNEKIKAQLELTTSPTASFVERFGLFTIIVLGEIVVGVVSGATHGKFSMEVGFLALSGTMIAIGLWWVYFDFVSHRKPKKGIIAFSQWYYLHLPLMIAITAVGASVLFILDHSYSTLKKEVQYLLSGSVSVGLICVALLIRTVDKHGSSPQFFNIGSWTMILSALGFVAIAFAPLNTVQLLSFSVILLFIPIGIAFATWIKTYTQ